MTVRPACCLALVAVGLVLGGTAGAGPGADFQADRPTPAKPTLFAEREAVALDLVREHLPELLQVLHPLQASNPAEYRKAIDAIATEAQGLQEMRARNPSRAALALESWKTRNHAELIAAQLAGSPTPERASQLRAAIEARVEVDIRRHQFEADQAEAALVRARENLARAEAHRDKTRDSLNRIEKNREARVDARFRALQPKKAAPTITKPSSRTGGKATANPVRPLPTTSLIAGPPLSASIVNLSPPMPSPGSLAEGKL